MNCKILKYLEIAQKVKQTQRSMYYDRSFNLYTTFYVLCIYPVKISDILILYQIQILVRLIDLSHMQSILNIGRYSLARKILWIYVITNNIWNLLYVPTTTYSEYVKIYILFMSTVQSVHTSIHPTLYPMVFVQ